MRRELYGNEHYKTAFAMCRLADVLATENRLAQAESLYREGLAIFRKRNSKSSGQSDDLCRLAHVLACEGKAAESLELLETNFNELTEKLGSDDRDTLNAMSALSWGYWSVARPVEALPLAKAALQRQKARLGPDDFDTLVTMDNLASIYEALDQFDKALPLFEEIVARLKTTRSPDNRFTFLGNQELGVAYQESGRLDDAQQTLQKALRLCKTKLGSENPDFAGTLAELCLTLNRQGKFAEAEPLLRQALVIFEKHQPNNWSYFYTQTLLGAALAGQKNYSAAEPLLVQGYQGMKEHENGIPGNRVRKLDDALDRLVQYYEASGHPDQAAEWRRQRVEFDQAQAISNHALPLSSPQNTNDTMHVP
jgi:tetratricopeptide (TPR) repeat protein